MPDQFGNPTPPEILSQISQERDSTISGASNPMERRNAIMFAMGRMLNSGQDPRLERAQEIEHAVGQSMGLTRGEAESALDYEIRRGRDLFERLKFVDPTSASEVSGQLIKLEDERFQQSRLKAEDARVATEFEQSQQDVVNTRQRRSITEDLFYEFDPKVGKVTDFTTNVSDPDHLLARQQVKDRGNWLITSDQAYRSLLDTDAANIKLLGSEKAQHATEISSAIASVITARDMAGMFADVMESGNNPNTLAEVLSTKGGSILSAWNETRRMLNPQAKDVPMYGSPEFASDSMQLEKYLQDRNVRVQVPTALLTLYAYSVARSVDGRVTEQDFKNIYDMLGAAGGSPTRIVSIMRAQISGTQEKFVRTIRPMAEDYMANGNALGKAQGRELIGLLDQLDDVSGEFDERIQRIVNVERGRDPRTKAGPTVGFDGNSIRTPEGRVFVLE